MSSEQDKGTEKASEATNYGLDTITRYRNAAQEKSAEIVQAALDNYEEAKQFAADKAGQMQSKISKGEQATPSDSLQDGGEAAGEKTQGLLGSAKQYAEGIYGAAIGYISKTDEENPKGAAPQEQTSTVEGAKDYVKDAGNKTMQEAEDQYQDSGHHTAGNAYDYSTGKASQLYNTAQDQSQRAYSDVKEAAGDLLQGMKQKIEYTEKKSVETKDSAGSKAREAMDASKEGVEDFTSSSGQKADEVAEAGKDKSSSLIETAASVVPNTIEYVKEALLGSGDGGSSSSGTSMKTDDSANSDKEALLTHVSVHE